MEGHIATIFILPQEEEVPPLEIQGIQLIQRVEVCVTSVEVCVTSIEHGFPGNEMVIVAILSLDWNASKKRDAEEGEKFHHAERLLESGLLSD